MKLQFVFGVSRSNQNTIVLLPSPKLCANILMGGIGLRWKKNDVDIVVHVISKCQMS